MRSPSKSPELFEKSSEASAEGAVEASSKSIKYFKEKTYFELAGTVPPAEALGEPSKSSRGVRGVQGSFP